MKITSIFKPVMFYFALFGLVYACGVAVSDIDVDLWARLINGQHVVKFHSPAFYDVVSFSKTHIWFDPEWITSGILYLVQQKFGIVGITLAKIIPVMAFFFLLVQLTGKLYKNQNPYNFGYYLFVFFIFLQAGYLYYSARCQIVTFIFLLIWVFFLEKIRNGQNKYLYFMPLIMLLWLNMHGGCIAGCGILVFYLIGEILNKKPFKKYIFLLLSLVFVFMINPWGLDYLKFMYHSAFLDRCWISEWQSPFTIIPFKKFYFIFYVILCGFSYIFYILKNKTPYSKIDKTRILLFILLAYLPLKHIKHIGLALVIYSLLFYDIYFFAYNSLAQKLQKYLEITDIAANRLKILKNAFLYTVVLVMSAAMIYLNPIDKSYIKYFAAKYPFYEMEFLKQNNIKGNILTQFEYGSFIGYKYYPDYKILIDGRQEQLWDSDILDELMFFIAGLGKNPQAVVEKYKPDIILLNKLFAREEVFDKLSEYSDIYSDGNYVVYVLNKHKKFAYEKPEITAQEYVKTLFDTKIDFVEEIKK